MSKENVKPAKEKLDQIVLRTAVAQVAKHRGLNNSAVYVPLIIGVVLITSYCESHDNRRNQWYN